MRSTEKSAEVGTMNEQTLNPASEALQEAFISACTELHLSPRQAWLLASIWQYREESERLAVGDSMLAAIEFSPEFLPCAGQCCCKAVSVAPTGK